VANFMRHTPGSVTGQQPGIPIETWAKLLDAAPGLPDLIF
jgi:hypothetical protein